MKLLPLKNWQNLLEQPKNIRQNVNGQRNEDMEENDNQMNQKNEGTNLQEEKISSNMNQRSKRIIAKINTIMMNNTTAKNKLNKYK